jgi:hypothetical protein
MDCQQWLGSVRAHDGTKDLCVAGELATDILRAFCPVYGEHTIVLPALHNLRMLELVPTHVPL